MRRSLLIVCCLAMGACAPVMTNTSLSSGNRVELERRAEIRMQLATAYYSEGQYATALSELEQALQIGERKADVLGLRGLVLMQLGDAEAASKNLQQALQIEPTWDGFCARPDKQNDPCPCSNVQSLAKPISHQPKP